MHPRLHPALEPLLSQPRLTLGLWVLAAVFATLSGCVVNPVPTPGQPTSSLDNSGKANDASASADTTTQGGTGSADSEIAANVDGAQADAQADADADTDAQAAADADADGGDSTSTSDTVECCPLDPPGCDCVFTGGTKGPSGCIKVCDTAPVGWKKLTDSNGCPYWQTGPQSCMVLPVQCGSGTKTFPDFTKWCQADSDCDFVIHQTDCCGNSTAVGVWKEVKGAFESAESQCKSQYPDCECLAMPPQAEEGGGSYTSTFKVSCKNAQCTTAVGN